MEGNAFLASGGLASSCASILVLSESFETLFSSEDLVVLFLGDIDSSVIQLLYIWPFLNYTFNYSI